MRVLNPLFETQKPTHGIKARDLTLEVCPKPHAVAFVREHHSRLPNCQAGPWVIAFRAAYETTTVAVALWNSPSARTLPNNWLELRRLACAPDAPFNTCSRFISWMVKYFKENRPDIVKLISYQDAAVHTGTIYKASNWYVDFTTKARRRDRSKPRAGTNRNYRSNINGDDIDSAPKIRWAIDV